MNNSAEKAVMEKLDSVDSEQGSPREIGADPPSNFGHSSASSAGVGKSIPVGGGDNGGGAGKNGY